MNFSITELTALVGQYLCPLARIAAMISMAPVFGTKTVPAKVKIILSFAIAVTVAPLVTTQAALDPVSLRGFEIQVKEMKIGAMIGFAVAGFFIALISVGQLSAQMMGLGFASMMDPQNGVSVPVCGQFYTILATLLFLSLNGHLLLIEMVASSIHSLPVGAELSRTVLLEFAMWGKR